MEHYANEMANIDSCLNFIIELASNYQSSEDENTPSSRIRSNSTYSKKHSAMDFLTDGLEKAEITLRNDKLKSAIKVEEANTSANEFT